MGKDLVLLKKLHLFRNTLNPDSHLFTSNNPEDIRNFASEMLDFLYSLKFDTGSPEQKEESQETSYRSIPNSSGNLAQIGIQIPVFQHSTTTLLFLLHSNQLF